MRKICTIYLPNKLQTNIRVYDVFTAASNNQDKCIHTSLTGMSKFTNKELLMNGARGTSPVNINIIVQQLVVFFSKNIGFLG